jgi:hypothetical protein
MAPIATPTAGPNAGNHYNLRKFGKADEKDSDLEADDQAQPSFGSKYSASKIPVIKGRSSHDSTDGSSSPLSIPQSPKFIEGMRHLTKLDYSQRTPIKSAGNNPLTAGTTSHGFTVTPLNFSTKPAEYDVPTESPSSAELLKRLQATREQFQQSLNATNQERTSPKLLTKSIIGDDSFLKKPLLSESPTLNKGSPHEEGASDGDAFQRSYQARLQSYQESRGRLENVRQRSKEMLLKNQKSTANRGSSTLASWLRFFLIVFLFSSLVGIVAYVLFVDDRLFVSLLEYFVLNL